MGKVLNLANWSSNYATSMASTMTKEKYKQGIGRFNGNPMALAAAQKDKAVNNYQAAADRMAAKLMSTPVSRWSGNAQTIGAERLQSGAKKGQAKLDAYIREKGPQIQALLDTVNGMANNTESDADARMQAWVNGMRAIKRGGV